MLDVPHLWVLRKSKLSSLPRGTLRLSPTILYSLSIKKGLAKCLLGIRITSVQNLFNFCQELGFSKMEDTPNKHTSVEEVEERGPVLPVTASTVGLSVVLTLGSFMFRTWSGIGSCRNRVCTTEDGKVEEAVLRLIIIATRMMDARKRKRKVQALSTGRGDPKILSINLILQGK